ncbi:MAG TPA: phosphate ABC transporter ATP-binding protein [Paracoccaceae bacterium]|nr:phosphate ABC transporter ATP-binding protein [Paracoccaceae bacterium]HMO70786.1 phosphate ABC transporter ATP-binding protein [Paracoccaceae bacterium]
MLDLSARTRADAALAALRPPLIEVRGLSLWYGAKQALDGVSFDLHRGEILAFMGPSGCGKTTALKCLNRMHDAVPGLRIAGAIRMGGQDIQDPAIDPPLHRRRFGWVAQKPNPFPGSVWHNVACGPAMHGICAGKDDLAAHVEDCLRRARLWDEVKDDLHHGDALALSGGQQQRLCIARALSTQPEVLLMDEPTGSIDPIATAAVEDLLMDLRPDHAIVVITHSLSQARRIADRVAYFHLGRLIEIGPAAQVFEHPRAPETAGFLRGRFG